MIARSCSRCAVFCVILSRSTRRSGSAIVVDRDSVLFRAVGQPARRVDSRPCLLGRLVAGAAWSTPERRGALIALGIATILATLANPYGIGMWRFLAETVRPERHDVTDWKPLLQLPIGIIVLDLLLPAIAICGIALRRRECRRLTWRSIAMLGFATWRVGRVDAFFEAAVGILLAPQILSVFRATRQRLTAPFWRSRCRWAAPSSPPESSPRSRGHPAHRGQSSSRRMAAGSGQRRNRCGARARMKGC